MTAPIGSHRTAKPLAAVAPGARRRCWRAIGLLLALVALVSGCTRSFYRREADFEVAQLLAAKQNDPRWRLPDYRVYPSPAARYFDPFCPDRPPMTPDDPASHRLMHCVDGKRQWPGWDRQGCSPHVENPRWPALLPRDDDITHVLQAQREGLGSCWVHHFEHSEVRRFYSIPDTVALIALLALGYPDENPPRRPRNQSVLWGGL